MAAIIIGNRIPAQPVTRIVSDPTKGTVTTVEYVSNGQDDLKGLAKAAISAGSKIEYTGYPHFSQLAVSNPGFTGFSEEKIEPIVSYQLVTTQTTKDIKEHPRVLAIDHDSLQRALQLAKDFKDGIPLPTSLNLTLNDDVTQLFNLLIHGVTSYSINSHIARRTVSVPITGISAAASVVAPAGFTSAVAAIPINGPNDGARFKWGWRKTGSQFVVAANQRVEISTEWALAGWSLLLYSDITYPQPS